MTCRATIRYVLYFHFLLALLFAFPNYFPEQWSLILDFVRTLPCCFWDCSDTSVPEELASLREVEIVPLLPPAAWVVILAQWSQFHLSLEIRFILRVGGGLSRDTSHGSEQSVSVFPLVFVQMLGRVFPHLKSLHTLRFSTWKPCDRFLQDGHTIRVAPPNVLNFCSWHWALTSSLDMSSTLTI